MGDQWYIDQDGYEEETNDRQKRKEARMKMPEVLKAYGVECDTTRYDEWQPVKCPFHDDKRASASVSLRKGFFRCHTCDVSGDSLRLVMTDRHLTSAQAVAWIGNLS